mmetsp:Transcript_39630/g.84501  ORF Transcript_39630/g.84501 Transcript_39630/m.84501 type:complete len:234 (+) Transcript_39630:2055-2756(+)
MRALKCSLQLRDIGSAAQLRRRAQCCQAAAPEKCDAHTRGTRLRASGQEAQPPGIRGGEHYSAREQESGLRSEEGANDLPGHSSVQGAEGIVQEHQRSGVRALLQCQGRPVGSAGQADARALASRERGAALCHLREIIHRHRREVSLKGACLKDPVVDCGIVARTEEDVGPHSARKEHHLLGSVGHGGGVRGRSLVTLRRLLGQQCLHILDGRWQEEQALFVSELICAPGGRW